MSKLSPLRPIRRPVFIADFSGVKTAKDVTGSANSVAFTTQPSELSEVPIRYDFPGAGETRAGGVSDGYCFRVKFAAGRLATTYELLTAFLREQGYGALPVPASIEVLRKFKLRPKQKRQLSLFAENGYVHNPIKILFPIPAARRGELILELFNESDPDHLLRFHGLEKPRKLELTKKKPKNE